MRAETSATSAVVTLSVAVAVVGHVLAGGSASLAVVPQLLALAAACWLLGEFLAGRRWLSVAVLAGIQLFVHAGLDRPHPAKAADPMPAASAGHSSMHDMHDMHAMQHAHGTHGMADTMAMPAPEVASPLHSGLSGALTMTAAHLVVLLAGVVLIGSTHRWVQRVLRILTRLVPQLPAAVIPLPGVRTALPGVPERPLLTQRWLTSNVSRRGPPAYRVLTALS
ncbi:hypothetical protein GCM10009789_84780 [Kribbella sancticallisti]|uniref:Uncharacterized protein n=1 Tax=Kribbella sancticallisti TaxID=460087 RepID=A0ABP4QRD1_9ACTN